MNLDQHAPGAEPAHADGEPSSPALPAASAPARPESERWKLADSLVWSCSDADYERVGSETGYSYATLLDLARVARRIPASRRRPSLSFGHHRRVASMLPAEQDWWLREAEARGWSCGRFSRILARARPESAPRPPKDLYFARGRNGLIKIGVTGDLDQRMSALKTELILVLPGRESEERGFHRRFRRLRVEGEWFRPGPALLRYLERSA
jgi:hypothetical protein